jgi:hypothetical protein
MNLKIFSLACLLALQLTHINAQSTSRDEIGGHSYHVVLPDYLKRTVGINASASIEFYNDSIGVAGFMIDDVKADLGRADITFDNVQVYFETFLLDFTDGLDTLDIGLIESKSVDGRNFRFVDVILPDSETGEKIVYFTAVAETHQCFYKVLIWCEQNQYQTIKQDFVDLLLSVHE